MRTESLDPSALRRFGALGLATAIAAATLAVYAVHGSREYNALELPGERSLQLNAILPEGWNFFTRSPRAGDPCPFVRTAAGWTSAHPGPHASAATLFGLRRDRRAQGVELGALVTAVPATAWTECRGAPRSCLDRANAAPPRVTNRSPRPTFCGRIGLVIQPPVPWAWARRGRNSLMPSRVVVAEVSC